MLDRVIRSSIFHFLFVRGGRLLKDEFPAYLPSHTYDLTMIKIRDCEICFPSQCPEGTYAGTVIVWEASNPVLTFLYSESGQKFTNSREFYQSLWDRGFRYFKYAYHGQMKELYV
jgi:hypothetical protein